MKTPVLAVMNVVLLASACGLALTPSAGFAFPDDKPAAAPAATTEDVVYMSDGRVFHGKITSETKALIIFEYIDAKLNTKTKLTLMMDQVAHIDRNVAVADPVKAADAPSTAPLAPGADKNKDKKTESYGASRVQSDSLDVPSIYIIPMKGQMGTDVNSEVYEKVREDVRKMKPDMVVVQMDCQDVEDVLYSLKGQEETGLADMDDFRKMCNIFQDDLREFKQVVWIHDSMGISSTVAMTWPDMYMKPTARLGGMIAARNQTGFDGWADEDVRGKMTAAFMAWIKGFLESGHYAFELADAMVQPKYMLSATWQGRKVIWANDTNGEYVVDSSDKRTTEFRAKDAEDLCISKGTAETMDDLALLLGYREYRVLDGQGEKICKDYVDNWRRAYEECQKLFKDYQDYMRWASGDDAVKYLGKAKSVLEQLVSKVETYKPLETRLAREFGFNKTQIKIQIDVIKERLRALRNVRGAGGGAGGGGGGRGPGGGAPGGGRGPGGG